MDKSKQEYHEGFFHTITNYLFWFFLGNLYFLLLNIPLLFILIVFLYNVTNPIPRGGVSIFICCIPIGPAVTALLSVMGKLIREKDIDITKDFFKAYKVNFFQSLFFSTLEIVAISLLAIDIKFFTSGSYPRVVTSFIFVVITFILLMSIHVFPIISRFYLSRKDILKTAAYYTIRKFHITILSFVSILVVGFIALKVFPLISVFAASIICYLIMFYHQKILLEIEGKLKNQNNREINQ
jgi:uncharacterized membrane protein YesL